MFQDYKTLITFLEPLQRGSLFFLISIGFQLFLYAWDEFFCHQKREVALPERISYCFNNLSLAACFFLALFWPLDQNWFAVVGGLTGVTLLLILKEEFVHKPNPKSVESLLHACLLMLTPLNLIFSFILLITHEFGHFFMLGQGIFMFLFALTQLIPKKPKQDMQTFHLEPSSSFPLEP
jgi:hypothetical protein